MAVVPYQQEGGVVEQLKQSSSLPLHMRYMSGEFMMTLVVSNQWNGQWTGRRNSLWNGLWNGTLGGNMLLLLLAL